MYLYGWGYGWGPGVTMNDPTYLPFARLTLKELESYGLTEADREHLEDRHSAIFDADDPLDVPDGPDLLR